MACNCEIICYSLTNGLLNNTVNRSDHITLLENDKFETTWNTTKCSVKIAHLCADISTWDLSNTKQSTNHLPSFTIKEEFGKPVWRLITNLIIHISVTCLDIEAIQNSLYINKGNNNEG